jgi:pimeloyl-ACP methyl ester carboxylesterase
MLSPFRTISFWHRRRLNMFTRMRQARLICIVLLSALLLAPRPVWAEEPFGIALEGFSYPHPVRFLAMSSPESWLNMAYMDVRTSAQQNGRVALLLHGRNFPSSYWQSAIKALAESGYRVVVPDQIGFGKSSKPVFDLHFDALARNTAQLLDSLGVDKVDIVAHSMGGMLATRFARSYPERVDRIVLAGPIGLEDYRLYVPPVSSEALLAQEERVTAESFRNWMMKAYELTLAPEAIEPYVEARTRIRDSAEYPRWLRTFVNSYQMIWREPVAGEIPLLAQPVLFLIGENDHVAVGRDFAPEELRSKMGQNVELAEAHAAKMKSGKVEVFEGIGHLIHLEAEHRFNASVLRFLNEGR